MAVPSADGSVDGEYAETDYFTYRWDASKSKWNLVNAGPCVASGGSESDITDGSDFHLHDFTSSGTLTVTKPGWAQIEMRGAGGSSGDGNSSWAGLGGGAGGYLNMKVWLEAGTYTVTVPGNATSQSQTGSPAVITGPNGFILWVPGGGYGGNNNNAGGVGGSNGRGNTGTPYCAGKYGFTSNGSRGGGAGGSDGTGKTTTFRGVSETICIGADHASNTGSVVANSGNAGNTVPTFTSHKNGSSGYVGIRYRR